MKNILIVILSLFALVAGYIAATSKLRLSLEGIQGKTVKITRGDLTLPINATGEVRPARRVEIKSEASGEVVEIARYAGDRVIAGELLIRLQKDDEQRSVNRAQLELEVAKARLEQARIRLRQAQTADIHGAEATVDQLQASADFAQFRLEKLKDLPEHQRNSEEMQQRETTLRGQLAQLDGAKANLEKARLAVPRVQQAVKEAESTFESAKNNLGDAQKRLTKTDIVTPIEGIVADIRTHIGEVIQGGKTTLTGGTVLAVVLDTDILLVRAEVDESDIGRVLEIAPPWSVPGRQATVAMPADLARTAESAENLPIIKVESFRDEEFVGIVERIYPEPRNLRGVVTYLVDVVIVSENKKLLLPGMRADVRFTSEHVENVLLCPNEAIREGPGESLGVYVPRKDAPPGEKEIEFIPCTFGLDNGNYSEVKEGLREGMNVYSKLPAKDAKSR